MAKFDATLLDINASILTGLLHWVRKEPDKKKKYRDKVLSCIKSSFKETEIAVDNILEWCHDYYKLIMHPVCSSTIYSLKDSWSIGSLLEGLRITLNLVRVYCKTAGVKPVKLPSQFNGMEEQALIYSIAILRYTYMLYKKLKEVDPPPQILPSQH